MFIVKEIRTATCVMCARESECLHVEGQTHPIRGWVCLPDFKKLVRIAGANGHPEVTPQDVLRQARPRE